MTWERRDVVQTNWGPARRTSSSTASSSPTSWSVNASTIVTTKYFRGAVGTPAREWSLKQLIDRVVLTYSQAGKEHGYFATRRGRRGLRARADLDAAAPGVQLQLAGLVQRRNRSPRSRSRRASPTTPWSALRTAWSRSASWSRHDAVGTKVFDAHGLTTILAVKANGVKDVLRLHTKAGLRAGRDRRPPGVEEQRRRAPAGSSRRARCSPATSSSGTGATPTARAEIDAAADRRGGPGRLAAVRRLRRPVPRAPTAH